MPSALCGLFLLLATTVAAQDLPVLRIPAAQERPARRARFTVPPSDVDVLLAAQAVLHTADMVSTVYNLRISRDAREANPMLRAFTGRPVRLTIVSGAIDILQTYTIAKLQRRHPKIARWWALALVGTEVWTTIDNIDAAGELQRRRVRLGQ